MKRETMLVESFLRRSDISRLLDRRFVYYCMVGLATNAIGYIVFYIGVRQRIGINVSIGLSYTLTCVIGMFMNSKITFRGQGEILSGYVKYLIQYVVLYFVNVLLTKLFVDLLAVNVYVSQVICIGIISVVGYVSSALFVFKPQ
jgi:putative flippase GtrA